MKQAFVNECPDWSFPAEYESEHRFAISDYVSPDTRFGRFVRRNAILFVALVGLMLWTWCIASIAYHNGKVDATATVTAEMEAEKEAAVQAVRDEYAAKAFTADDASRQAAIQADAKHLAKMAQAFLNTYKAADIEDAEKLMLCAVCRVISGGEFSAVRSIEEACTAANQWWGYADAYTQEVYDKAVEIATIYETGDAMPCDTDMVYASWNGTEIVLRNRWEDNSYAKHW